MLSWKWQGIVTTHNPLTKRVIFWYIMALKVPLNAEQREREKKRQYEKI
jgi:hypothetical protein